MKNLKLVGIALLMAMLVLGLVGCPDPNNGGGTDDPNDKVATLVSLTVGGQAATLGTPASTYAAAIAGSVTVFENAVTVNAVPTVTGVQVWYQKVDAGEQPDPDDYFIDVEYTFSEPGDILAIEVTSKDGSTKLYYKIAVTVADVALSSLTIGGADVTISTPSATWQNAQALPFLFDIFVDEQNPAGYTVVATPELNTSTVEYAVAKGTDEPVFSSTATFTNFASGDFLYIKVTSVGGSSAFYKVQVNFKQEAVIKYGSPVIQNNVLDTLWNNPDLQEYEIRRVYPDDGAGLTEDYITNPTTYGVAKALWDEVGLYVYVKVTDPDVSTAPKYDSQAHETDSVELFINEDLSFVGSGSAMYSNAGSQYRVGANGELSGEGASVAAFEDLDNTSAWKTEDGYVVVFQAPWRFRAKFYDSFVAGKEIGFELQINAAGPDTGNRYATIVWNNTENTNYMNAANFGVAALEWPTTPLNWPALAPTLDGPLSGIYEPEDPVSLTVYASTPDSGTLSYQWYSNTTNSNVGGTLLGETSDTYSFTASAVEGAYYYYAVVTNTLSGANTAQTTSAVAVVTVSDVPMVERVTLRQSGVVYQFTLPEGVTWGDYNAISAEYQVDATNIAKGIRFYRLLGNYLRSDFSPSGSGMLAAFDTYNAPYILDNKGGSFTWSNLGAVADTWFTISYDISGASAHGNYVAANKPGDSDTGPFYFAIGIAGNSGDTIVQLIRNVTLVHKTDASKNVVTRTSGMAGSAFAGYGGNDGMNANRREWIADPSTGIVTDVDFVLDYSDAPLTNATAVTGNYARVHLVDLGADFDITKYATFTFELKYYDADKVEVAPAASIAQMKWRSSPSATCIDGSTSWRWDLGNIGDGLAVNTNAAIPAYLFKIGQTVTLADAPSATTGDDEFTVLKLRYLDFETTDSGEIQYIEITKISFFLP